MHLFESHFSETARISCMSLVDLFFSLLACYLNLFSVDNDNVVTSSQREECKSVCSFL